MYEILDDYKDSSKTDKDEIFNEFINLIYTSDNEIEIHDKSITFEIPKYLEDTDIGRLLKPFREIKYKCSNSKTLTTDFVSLIRQKINNLYVNYCEKDVCTRKEYINLLYTPQNIFYNYINKKENCDTDEILNTIESSLDKANKVKEFYSKQKMDIEWNGFKNFIVPCLRKAFENFIPLDKFSNYTAFVEIADDWCEDNFPVKYLCRCLGTEIKNYQKLHYGLYIQGSHDKLIYKRCKDCGAMYLANKKSNLSIRCMNCQSNVTRINTKLRVRKFRKT